MSNGNNVLSEANILGCRFPWQKKGYTRITIRGAIRGPGIRRLGKEYTSTRLYNNDTALSTTNGIHRSNPTPSIIVSRRIPATFSDHYGHSAEHIHLTLGRIQLPYRSLASTSKAFERSKRRWRLLARDNDKAPS